MCGICGKLSLRKDERVEREELRRMLDLIPHRGPDGQGEYFDGPVALGHTRLSIIDLSTGSQPMANEDGTVEIVFNGEIYNYQALREKLIARGHQFSSTTDTEVIIHLYEEKGPACVEDLEGMFAFAIWDKKRSQLFIARDRVGIKPLYYCTTPKRFLFASEMKCLLADPEVSRAQDLNALGLFLKHHYVPGEATLVQSIRKLLPGHWLLVKDGQVTIRQYWDLTFPDKPRIHTMDEAVESLKSLLKDVVRSHMISDVPVGVLLSGGVDSTGVLKYASEASKSQLKTFTVGFAGEGFADERPYAAIASAKYGSEHQEVSFSATDFGNWMPLYVWHMEEPVVEPPALALYAVTKRARESGVKVLLSGEGGDEAFGGYPDYRRTLVTERVRSLSGPLLPLTRLGLRMLGGLGVSKAYWMDRYLGLEVKDYYFSRATTPFTLLNENRKQLLKDSTHLPQGRITESMLDQQAKAGLLHQLLYVDTKTWLPDDLLVKADKMTMATSVELRVPLLDHKVLEFAAGLHPDLKVKGGQLKRALKAALSECVPAEILNRKKTGFPVPYGRWMRHELKDRVWSDILDSSGLLHTHMKRSAVESFLKSTDTDTSCDKELFGLWVLSLWEKEFLNNPLLSLGDENKEGKLRAAG